MTIVSAVGPGNCVRDALSAAIRDVIDPSVRVATDDLVEWVATVPAAGPVVRTSRRVSDRHLITLSSSARSLPSHKLVTRMCRLPMWNCSNKTSGNRVFLTESSRLNRRLSRAAWRDNRSHYASSPSTALTCSLPQSTVALMADRWCCCCADRMATTTERKCKSTGEELDRVTYNSPSCSANAVILQDHRNFHVDRIHAACRIWYT